MKCNNLTTVDQRIQEEAERSKAFGRPRPLRVLFVLRLVRKILNFDAMLEAWISSRLRRVHSCSDEPLTYYEIFHDGAGPVRSQCGERYVDRITNRTVYIAVVYFSSLLYDAQAQRCACKRISCMERLARNCTGVVSCAHQRALIELIVPGAQGKHPWG